MWVLLVLLVVLGFVAAFLQLRAKSDHSDEADTDAGTSPAPSSHQKSEACNTCAADGTGCYAERMMRHTAQEEPQYFDDEELDALKEIPADKYTPEQVELFDDVLHTLRKEEVADWLHALSMRHIEFPASLRDEAIMLLQE